MIGGHGGGGVDVGVVGAGDLLLANRFLFPRFFFLLFFFFFLLRYFFKDEILIFINSELQYYFSRIFDFINVCTIRL